MSPSSFVFLLICHLSMQPLSRHRPADIHSGVKSAILRLIGGTDFSSVVELILFYVELNQLHYEG
jgi:hypothetical protein